VTRTRLTVAVLAAAAALALPAAALAVPTAPHVQPVPATVTVWPGADSFTVAWHASTFDDGAYWTYYEVAVTRYPVGAPSSSSTTTEKAGCCAHTFHVVPGYHYVVRVRATEFYWCGMYGPCQFSWSPWWVVWFDTVSLPIIDFGV
jgi:hypothetical protein